VALKKLFKLFIQIIMKRCLI